MASLNGKNILITGGFGYIGKHMVRALEGCGAEIEIWDNKVKRDRHRNMCVGWIKDPHVGFNIIDIQAQWYQIDYYRKHKHFDAIIHLAAIASVPECEANPGEAKRVNIEGSFEIARLALEHGALLLNADSAMSPFSSQSVYAHTKQTIRQILIAMRPDLNAVNMTLFNVAGADSEGDIGEDHEPETHFIPNLVKAALTGETFKLDNNPNVKRDFVHVSDVCDAFKLAVELYFDGKLEIRDYEVGTGYERSLQSVVDLAVYSLETDIKVEEITSGRFEPYDYYKENQLVSAKFAADRENWVPGWLPKRLMPQILWTEEYFQKETLKHRLPD